MGGDHTSLRLGILEIDVGAPAAAIDLFKPGDRPRPRARGQMGGGVRPGQSCGSSHISAGHIDAAHQDLRDVSSDALAVGAVDLTIGLIELLAMLWVNPAM